MSEELKITKERVLSAAGKCGTAEEILKELFPEVFEGPLPEWEDVTENCGVSDFLGEVCIQHRWDYPFVAKPNQKSDAYKNGFYKIKNGRIWLKRRG